MSADEGMTGGRGAPSHERDVAASVVRRLRDAGHEAYFVGGCVREMLLGHEPSDYDVTTDALPDRVAEIFTKVVEVGRRFGVMTVVEEGVHVEVATFRTDGSYTDGRRPDDVSFADAKGDVLRRDFTINALLYDPVGGEVVDHVGGRADLDARLLRTVGDPKERLGEDHLRMLRAVRFAARLDLTIDPATREACRELGPLVARVSPERVREEIARMLVHPTRSKAVALMDEMGLLEVVLPEVAACKGIAQPADYHPEGDVFVHVLLALAALPADASEDVAWAVLLHDVGKPGTYAESGGRIRFHGHAELGADMVDRIADRLKFSGQSRAAITWLVRTHLKPRDAPQMRKSTLRRFLAESMLDDLLVVCRADALGGSGDVSHVEYLAKARDEMGSELPPPLVTGADLFETGLPAGPAYGRILESVRTAQLEGTVTTRESALELLRDLVAMERGSHGTA